MFWFKIIVYIIIERKFLNLSLSERRIMDEYYSTQKKLRWVNFYLQNMHHPFAGLHTHHMHILCSILSVIVSWCPLCFIQWVHMQHLHYRIQMRQFIDSEEHAWRDQPLMLVKFLLYPPKMMIIDKEQNGRSSRQI